MARTEAKRDDRELVSDRHPVLGVPTLVHEAGYELKMTDDEYEDAYREALTSLRERSQVGNPFIGLGGRRVCEIDGKHLNDREVFELLWGKRIASRIVREPRASTLIQALLAELAHEIPEGLRIELARADLLIVSKMPVSERSDELLLRLYLIVRTLLRELRL